MYFGTHTFETAQNSKAPFADHFKHLSSVVKNANLGVTQRKIERDRVEYILSEIVSVKTILAQELLLSENERRRSTASFRGRTPPS